MAAPIVEVDAGTYDKVLDGLGHQRLARPRQRCNAGSDVDGEAADVAAADLALAGVQPGVNLEAERIAAAPMMVVAHARIVGVPRTMPRTRRRSC